VYTEFFGLNEKPFSISPDPRYLYMSQRHADALAHLIYGISDSGGFIQLTGEVGTGKTTLIRSLLQQLPDKADIALILNPQLSAKEFLQSICQELRVTAPVENSLKALIDALNARLLRAHSEGRRTVLIVDEAQTLSPVLLEQVRLLTNLETSSTKLLQIILIGQPELRELLERPQMRQLAQRVTGRYHLEPLSRRDTHVYVQHRMKIAGARAQVFSPAALRAIYKLSGGIPRLINIVADRALLAAYTRDRHRVGARLVRRAAAEVFGRARVMRRWWPALAAAVLAAALGLTTLDLRLAGDDEAGENYPSVASTDAARPAPARAEEPPAVESSAVSPQPASLADLLTQPDLPTDMPTAAHALFALWQADYRPERGTACSQAAAQHLQCLFLAGGSLGELRRINRPSILTLTDANGKTRHVVLSSLGYDRAELTIGDDVYPVAIAELTHYWYGDHLLFWKPAFTDGEDLTPGTRSAGVKWVRESLAAIRGARSNAADPTLYDSELETWVREYQRERMLRVDGIVGAQTQIALSTDVQRPGIPTISKSH
jgi:general secretion pathway protein A